MLFHLFSLSDFLLIKFFNQLLYSFQSFLSNWILSINIFFELLLVTHHMLDSLLKFQNLFLEFWFFYLIELLFLSSPFSHDFLKFKIFVLQLFWKLNNRLCHISSFSSLFIFFSLYIWIQSRLCSSRFLVDSRSKRRSKFVHDRIDKYFLHCLLWIFSNWDGWSMRSMRPYLRVIWVLLQRLFMRIINLFQLSRVNTCDLFTLLLVSLIRGSFLFHNFFNLSRKIDHWWVLRTNVFLLNRVLSRRLFNLIVAIRRFLCL